MANRIPSILWSCFAAATLLASVAPAQDPDGAQADNKSIAETIKGKWVHYRDTPGGRFMTIKEHRGAVTILTTYDPKNNPVYAHQSDYTIEETDGVAIFRYRNKVVLAGPNTGAKDPREDAYILRIVGDEFFEVHGMLLDDKKRPGMAMWQRLKVDPIPKPVT